MALVAAAAAQTMGPVVGRAGREPNRASSMLNLRLRGHSRLPVVRQGEIAECGLACLSMLSYYYGRAVTLAQCRERGLVTSRGANLAMLRNAAAELGFHSRALRVSLPQLRQFSGPVVLHWRLNHFVVLVKANRRSLLVHDPAEGRKRISWQQADAAFTGVVLELAPNVNLTPLPEPPRLRLLDVARNLLGLKRGVAQLLVLSLLLQGTLLLGPLYTQVVVDDALRRGDAHLLAVLALGFGLLVILQLSISLVRGWLAVVLGAQLAHGAGESVARRLLGLSYGWFERRATGDILSRFRSVRPITDLLLQGSALALVDGLMAVLALLLMFSYSSKLALWVLGSALAFALLRILLYPSFKRRALAEVSAGALQDSQLLESLRGISTIKAFGLEQQRAEQWQRRYVQELNEGVGLARLQLGFSSSEALLFGLERVLVVYLGAWAVLDGSLTVGMLFAFLAYRGHFVERVSGLVDCALSLKALDVHLERLADIVLAEPAATGNHGVAKLPSSAEPVLGVSKAVSVLALCDAHYRYDRYADPVLGPVQLHLAPGELVVLYGPSGSGKSTLAQNGDGPVATHGWGAPHRWPHCHAGPSCQPQA